MMRLMKLSTVTKIVEATVITGETAQDREIAAAFSSDLMSDVLTLLADNLLLITGLCNIQAIRTAEMADIPQILFVRGKSPTDKMVDLAVESGITLLTSPFSMYRCSGILYQQGLKALF
jgi:serine kinase of HPr protein (carbohydrate metabolism regulator)